MSPFTVEQPCKKFANPTWHGSFFHNHCGAFCHYSLNVSAFWNISIKKLDCKANNKIFEMSPQPLTFFLPKRQFSNKKIWCLETKLWSKVIFSQYTHGYAETSVSFVHVTDCYCSGKTNLNKFFLTTKLPFGDFEQLWLCLCDRNTCAMNSLLLHSEKRGCSGLTL